MLNQTNAGFFGVPFAGSLPENQPFYQAMGVCEAKTTDSGLTYNVNAPDTRKRPRTNQLYAEPEKHTAVSQLPPFAVGEDHFLRYQYEIDSIISQHSKKMRLELEERRKQHARLLIWGVMKKLKDKDEEIQRIGKLNLALQERVRSIFLENQLWRDLAESNEATVNSLRTNLDQLLMQVGAVEEDAESCCASTDDKDVDRNCKMCGERESCVLLLPCRHLCLCGVCGSGSRQLQACPLCNSSMNATLHVNLSS